MGVLLPCPLPILLDRDDLLAVVKPPGLPVHATLDGRRPHVLGLLGQWLAERRDFPGPAEPVRHLGLVHRLDVETSGVLLLCRNKALEAELGKAFAERRVQKTYVAACARLPAERIAVEVVNYLRAERQAGGKERMIPVRSGGDPARSTVCAWLDGPGPGGAAIILPKTGRRHQIRAHLAGLGTPIVGDTLYGAPPGGGRVMLHAWRLQLRHPRTGEDIALVADLPEDLRAAIATASGRTSAEVEAWLANWWPSD